MSFHAIFRSLFRALPPGICQESCRDLGHVQGGLAAAINLAETAHLQGIDLYYGEQRVRLTAAMELTTSLLAQQPDRQPVPPWLCGTQTL